MSYGSLQVPLGSEWVPPVERNDRNTRLAAQLVTQLDIPQKQHHPGHCSNQQRDSPHQGWGRELYRECCIHSPCELPRRGTQRLANGWWREDAVDLGPDTHSHQAAHYGMGKLVCAVRMLKTDAKSQNELTLGKVGQ